MATSSTAFLCGLRSLRLSYWALLFAHKPFLTPYATALALLGGVLELCALTRPQGEVTDPEGRRVGWLAVALSAVCLVLGSIQINDHELHDHEPLGTAVSDALPLDSWRQPQAAARRVEDDFLQRA